jgi:putative colanic acid biosynthesis acetyltransferase WcaF
MRDKIKVRPYTNRLPIKERLHRLLWNVVWLCFFRLTPSWGFRGWRLFILKCFGAKAGKGCVIYPSCKIWAPWNLEMGDYACLASDVDCYTVAPIKLGNKVSVSQRSFLCTASHDISDGNRPLTFAPIVIQDFSWIAAQAFIGPGVTVGEGAVVGACAVVTKDVEPWTVVAGNPARVVKKRVIRETGNGGRETA